MARDEPRGGLTFFLRCLPQEDKKWTKREGTERHLICIEDPFELSHDLGRVVDKHSLPTLKKEFKRAANLLRTS